MTTVLCIRLAAVLLVLGAVLPACGGNGRTSPPAPQPCGQGFEFALVSPAPGSTNASATNLTIVVAVSAALFPNQAGYNVVAAPYPPSSSTPSPASTPFLVGPVAPPSPAPSPPISSTAAYYMSSAYNLARGQAYTLTLQGPGCVSVPIAGASFTTALS
jgi:hypothetical protein